MKLDFTALQSIAGRNSADPATEQPSGALYGLTREQEERENARRTYKEYQQNIKQSANIRSEILKGIQNGEEPTNLLLKAIECISLMTGDAHFYTESKANIIAINGWGLQRPAPLGIAIEEAKQRLERLTRTAQGSEISAETQERLQRAITAHRKLIDRLECEAQRGAEYGA